MAHRLKVLGFDNWTGGAHLFARLREAFAARDMDLTLLHLGSWGNDPGRAPREVLHGLEVRDISSYGGMGYERILEAEKPDAVLLMSTDTFAHRAFIRYCCLRGIPTVHAYHGLVRVQAVDKGTPYKVNVLAQIRFASSKLYKALRHVWPVYARSLWATGARRDEWMRFGQDIVRFGTRGYLPVSAEDARTDHCCVYVAADVEHAMRKYGFARDRVHAVGNQDLMQFGVTAEKLSVHLREPRLDALDVMYVDTGLIYLGWVFTSRDEFIAHLVETRDALMRQGKRLILKPHPDHWRSGAVADIERAGIAICANDDFVARLERCCACIVETSTLAVLPGLLGMPMLLANYGKLRGQRFGEVLASYPRARFLRDIEALGATLEAEAGELDEAAVLTWIRDNSGPMPAEDMPHRVAAVVKFAIEQRSPGAADVRAALSSAA